MTKKSQPSRDNEEQSKRFLQTADAIKAEDDKELFEKACKKIIQRKTEKNLKN